MSAAETLTFNEREFREKYGDQAWWDYYKTGLCPNCGHKLKSFKGVTFFDYKCVCPLRVYWAYGGGY
jgi:hypothetical protein